jgi:hypothetical protein
VTTDLRVVAALLASPAAAILALFVWDTAIGALVYRHFEVVTDIMSSWVLLVVYVPALFATVVVGDAEWLVLHRLHLRQPPVLSSSAR